MTLVYELVLVKVTLVYDTDPALKGRSSTVAMPVIATSDSPPSSRAIRQHLVPWSWKATFPSQAP